MLGKMKYNMMVFMSKRMLSCEDTSLLMSKSFEEKLPIKQRFRLRMHVISCNLCRRYEKQLKQLNEVVVNYKTTCQQPGCQHSMSPDAKERISQHVNKELKAGS